MLTDNSYDKFKYILYSPTAGTTGLPLIVVLHGSGEQNDKPNAGVI